MTAFDAELRGLAERLDLPEPIRTRTLLELRSDLEAMAAALESRGVAGEEARRRAVETLLPSAESVAELRRVHRPLYQRLVDRFSVRGRHRLERLLLALLAAVYVASGLSTLARLDLLATPSPFLWPVLLIAVLIGVAGAGKLFHLFVAGARSDSLRRGLRLLPLLGAAVLVVAFGGLTVDLYVVAGRLAAGMSVAPELLAWLRREAALLSLALLAASAAGLIWLVAAVRVARIEQARAAALGFIQRRRTP